MPNLCDLIEGHLRRLLEASGKGFLEVQRNELAAQFDCVPSQINYVLETRFTVERGFLVESRRGGGGYIRILRLEFSSPLELLVRTYRAVGEAIAQSAAEHLILRLYDEGLLGRREAAIMKSAMARGVFEFGLPERDRVRARVLKAMLACLLRESLRDGAVRGVGDGSGRESGTP